MSRATGRRSGTANRQYNQRIPRDIQDRVCGRPLIIRFPEAGDAPGFTLHVQGISSGKIQFSLRTPDLALATSPITWPAAEFGRGFAHLMEEPVLEDVFLYSVFHARKKKLQQLRKRYQLGDNRDHGPITDILLRLKEISLSAEPSTREGRFARGALLLLEAQVPARAKQGAVIFDEQVRAVLIA